MSSHKLNSKNNGPVLLFKTIFRLWNCFLSPAATDCKDRHGLFLWYASKNRQKIITVRAIFV